MVYIPNGKTWVYVEEDELGELPIIPTRTRSRRERVTGLGISGLGITGLDMPATPVHERGGLQPPKRNVGARRSIVSLITRSVDLQVGKYTSSRASSRAPTPTVVPASSRVSTPALISTPQSDHSLSPESLSRASPSLWRHSNSSTPSLVTDLSSEDEDDDITTYHANLARFKTERAERAAELGLENYDLPPRSEPSRLEQLQAREDHNRNSSGLSLGKGLRAYWSGGGSPENKASRSPIKVSGGTSIKAESIEDANRVDTETLKTWWDQLGNGPVWISPVR